MLCGLILLFLMPLSVVPAGAATEGDYTYEVVEGKAHITKYLGSGGDVTIPSTLGGYPVAAIGKDAFFFSPYITSIVIPDGVTGIGDFAFYGCYFFASLDFPGSVTSIGIAAFGGYRNLTSITIPDSVTSLGEEAFSLCNQLTIYTTSEYVKSYADANNIPCQLLSSGEDAEDPADPEPTHTHAMTKVEAKPATCEEDGNLSYYICSK